MERPKEAQGWEYPRLPPKLAFWGGTHNARARVKGASVNMALYQTPLDTEFMQSHAADYD